MGPRKRVAVVADTNFLMLIPQGLASPTLLLEALERSYEILVPSTVLEELRMLASAAPLAKTRRLARSVLSMLESGRLQVRIVEAEGDVDDSIVVVARRLSSSGDPVVVATNDRALRRRLRMLGIPTLYYRESEGRLEVDWLQP